jgi:transcriptional regulator with XRE-family HTH domain
MRKAAGQMPRERKSTPRSRELAALGKAVELLMARGPSKTQTAVADVSGLNITQVGSYVRGTGSPNFENLLLLCDGLQAKPIELFALIEELKDKGCLEDRAGEGLASGAP